MFMLFCVSWHAQTTSYNVLSPEPLVTRLAGQKLEMSGYPVGRDHVENCGVRQCELCWSPELWCIYTIYINLYISYMYVYVYIYIHVHVNIWQPDGEILANTWQIWLCCELSVIPSVFYVWICQLERRWHTAHALVRAPNLGVVIAISKKEWSK